jgi:hypothetical protein
VVNAAAPLNARRDPACSPLTSRKLQSSFARQVTQREPALQRSLPPNKSAHYYRKLAHKAQFKVRNSLPMRQDLSGTARHLPGTVRARCRPQVGKMKRRSGPRSSQETRWKPGQSRSEPHTCSQDSYHTAGAILTLVRYARSTQYECDMVMLLRVYVS